MEKQFKRFLELSLKFTKTKSEVLGQTVDNYSMVAVGVHQGFYVVDSANTQDIKVKSTADLIREEAEKKAVLADEFEEYLELQKNLGEYFRVTEKLNN